MTKCKRRLMFCRLTSLQLHATKVHHTLCITVITFIVLPLNTPSNLDVSQSCKQIS